MSFIGTSEERELKHHIFGLQEDDLTGKKSLAMNYVPVGNHRPQAM